MDITSRERIIAALEHKEIDRIPFWENYWGSTLVRWKEEGFPANANPVDYFRLDTTHTTSIDWTLQFAEEVVEETDVYIVRRTANGTLAKNFKGRDTTPFWSDFQLRDRATWEELKPRMQWNDSRIDLLKAKAAYESCKDLFQIYLPACLGFEKFKYAMGMEGILMAFAEDPTFVQEMCMSTADLAIDGLEYLLANGFTFDAAFVTEDNGFRDRSFVSPRTYREVVLPCQKRFCEFCHARGIKVMLHTCGQNMNLVPLYIEAGFDCLNPMEVKAGMDPLKLKKDYGDVLAFWGGIDVRAIAHPNPAVLEKEIRTKVPVLKQGGGYIFASDHSIPDNVSLERYQRMLELGRECGTFV
jgi:uroporphyrinogen decarboxylase